MSKGMMVFVPFGPEPANESMRQAFARMPSSVSKLTPIVAPLRASPVTVDA
jgi:hypothetical protein